MTTAIDTNILVALWSEDDTLNTLARSALDAALGHGSLVIAAPVFAELLASPSRNEAFLDSFCRENGISVDCPLPPPPPPPPARPPHPHPPRRRPHPTSP